MHKNTKKGGVAHSTGLVELEKKVFIKPERSRKITEVVEEILKIAKVEPVSGTLFDKKTWSFVWNFINARMRPEYKNKHVTANDSLSCRMSRLLAYNLGLGFTDETFHHDNYVAKLSTKDKDTLHVYYGCGETDDDISFIKSTCDDPEKLQLEHGVPRGGRIILHLQSPKDIPLNDKVFKLLTEYPSIEFDHSLIPLTTDQIRTIDMEADKGKYFDRVGRLDSQKKLEIRQPTIDKAIAEISKQLPESSKLKKFIDAHRDEISVQVYENIKLYNSGNMDYAVGYLFEACVGYEIAEDGLGDVIASLFDNEDDISVNMDGGIYQVYRRYCSERFQGHTDGLILSSKSGEITRIEGILECKVSPNTNIFGDTSGQIISQVDNLGRLIEASHKNTNLNVVVNNPKDILVVVIKPNIKVENNTGKPISVYKTISEPLIIGKSRSYIIRSSIDHADLQTAKQIFNREVV